MANSRSKMISDAYVQRQLVLVDNLLTDVMKESIQAHLLQTGMSKEGVDSFHLKAVGETSKEGVRLGLPQGLPEKDYVVLHTFLTAMQKEQEKGHDAVKITIPEGKYKNNVLITAPDADQLTDVLNRAVSPAYRISMPAVRNMRAQVISHDTDLDFFIDNAFRSSQVSSRAAAPEKPQPLTPFQEEALKSFVDRLGSRSAGSQKQPLPKNSAIAFIAGQLKAEFAARVTERLEPYVDKAIIAKTVNENFVFKPADEFGVFKITADMTQAGVSFAYSTTRSPENIVCASGSPMLKEIGNKLDYDARIGSFRRDYTSSNNGHFTFTARSIEDLAQGINTVLRPELKINVSHFRDRG